MVSLLDLKKQITGIKNTQKITKAMQLVAASKMQQFQKKALATRDYVTTPVSYTHLRAHETREDLVWGG